MIMLNWYDKNDTSFAATEVLDINDLKTKIQNHTAWGLAMPFNIGLERIDPNANFGAIKSQELRIQVQRKLIYQDDIPTIVNGVFVRGTPVGFNADPKLKKLPVFFQFKNMADTNVYHVDWRPLNSEDIVVNAKLEQIWPARTGKLPAQIVNMFNNNLSDLFERQTGQFSNGPGRTYTRGLFGKRYYHRMYGNER
ncbi:MAG: hypothetical protein J5714_03605 [Alphaproteobacteria bacterium]|nr:hypothetical protein [Alphaproteobacteria bacterium]